MTLDPIVTNPNHDKVIFENEHVRVLEYTAPPLSAGALGPS